MILTSTLCSIKAAPPALLAFGRADLPATVPAGERVLMSREHFAVASWGANTVTIQHKGQAVGCVGSASVVQGSQVTLEINEVYRPLAAWDHLAFVLTLDASPDRVPAELQELLRDEQMKIDEAAVPKAHESDALPDAPPADMLTPAELELLEEQEDLKDKQMIDDSGKEVENPKPLAARKAVMAAGSLAYNMGNREKIIAPDLISGSEPREPFPLLDRLLKKRDFVLAKMATDLTSEVHAAIDAKKAFGEDSGFPSSELRKKPKIPEPSRGVADADLPIGRLVQPKKKRTTTPART
jgi:hypothetical protein